MKITLPYGQVVEIPDDFHPTPFLKYSKDYILEIDFFHESVTDRIHMYSAYNLGDGVKSKNWVGIDELLNHKYDWCYTLEADETIDGLYQICFEFNFDEMNYVRSEYHGRGSS